MPKSDLLPSMYYRLSVSSAAVSTPISFKCMQTEGKGSAYVPILLISCKLQ